MSKHRRRTLLKTASQGAVFVTAGGLVGGVQAQETVSVSGEVVTADGNPATDVTMKASTNSRPRTVTDSDGRFSLDVSRNSSFHIVLYEYKDDGSPPKRDGIPFIYDFNEKKVNESDKDLGTLTLPEAYVVNIRFLHADGEPAPSTEPVLAAMNNGYWFAGPSNTKVTRDGYLKMDGNNEPGVELGGPVLLGGEFDETGAKYEKSFNITEPTDLVVQAGKGFREASATTTEKSTTTTKTTPTPTTEETTAATSTTSRSSTTSTVTNSPTSRPTEQQSETSTNTTQRPKRGFFSNSESANGNPGVLKNPFFLTVSGFVLSVGGIIHQMVRGS